jgi:hypothetical protein
MSDVGMYVDVKSCAFVLGRCVNHEWSDSCISFSKMFVSVCVAVKNELVEFVCLVRVCSEST